MTRLVVAHLIGFRQPQVAIPLEFQLALQFGDEQLIGRRPPAEREVQRVPPTLASASQRRPAQVLIGRLWACAPVADDLFGKEPEQASQELVPARRRTAKHALKRLHTVTPRRPSPVASTD